MNPLINRQLVLRKTEHEKTGTRKSFGFSMIEALMVVLVLVAIVVMLLPVLGTGKRNAYSALCMQNLKQLNNAHQLVLLSRKTDGSLDESLKYQSDAWTAYLTPYISGEEKIFVCPEAGVKHASTPLNQLKFGIDVGGNRSQTPDIAEAKYSGIDYYMELDPERPWIKKLGWQQYLDLKEKIENFTGQTFEQAMYTWKSNIAAKDYWANHYRGFEPGDEPNRFVMFMEDYKVGTSDINSLAHENFMDFIIKVEPKENDPTHVTVTASHLGIGSREAGFLVWADTLESVYSPAEVLKPNESRSIDIPNHLSSYGANPNQIFSLRASDNRIQFLDYEDVVATPDNWDDWDDKVTGVPDFARHLGDKINVAYVDGSVQMTDETKINPSVFSLEALYW